MALDKVVRYRPSCGINSGLLSNYIENDNTIKGIQVNGTEIKQTLFADDATFYTDGSKQSFENI